MLSDYLNAELPAKNCRDLERHLKGCEPCIAYLESLRRTVEACRRYQVRQIPAPSRKVREALGLTFLQPSRLKNRRPHADVNKEHPEEAQ
jgi:anti-sigma factor RsiW